MEWENIDSFEEEDNHPLQFQSNESDNRITEENDRKIALQLSKFRDPSKDPDRQAYITLVTKFGTLLSQNKLEEIANTLMIKECKVFVMTNMFENLEKHSYGPEGFLDIFRERKYIERQVRETFVDVERSTVGQICECKIILGDNNTAHQELIFEFFSIKDLRITKYRGSFAQILDPKDNYDFKLTLKDKMLAKIKELNYALAGQPDLEKVASLLHESTEYKIWSWENEKCTILGKHDFKIGFQNLQQKFLIRQIVPFEIFTNNNPGKDIVISTYSYHLEAQDCQVDNKFVWLTTCIYAFDEDVNIKKVIQQGELHLEGEVSIPFEVFSRETLTNKIIDFYTKLTSNFDIFYNDSLHSDVEIYRIGPKGPGRMGDNHGINEFADLISDMPVHLLEWIKAVDIYFDKNNPGYDVLFTINCGQGTPLSGTENDPQKTINILSPIRICFEKGKIAKIFQILTPIFEPMPTPFDDLNFYARNIKAK